MEALCALEDDMFITLILPALLSFFEHSTTAVDAVRLLQPVCGKLGVALSNHHVLPHVIQLYKDFSSATAESKTMYMPLISGTFLCLLIDFFGIKAFISSIFDYILDAIHLPFSVPRATRTFRASSTDPSTPGTSVLEDSLLDTPTRPLEIRREIEEEGSRARLGKLHRTLCNRVGQGVKQLHTHLMESSPVTAVRYILTALNRELSKGNSQYAITTLLGCIDAWIQKDRKFADIILVHIVLPQTLSTLNLLIRRSAMAQSKPSQTQLLAFQDLLVFIKGLLERHRLSQAMVLQFFVIENNHVFKLLSEDTPYPDRNMLMQVADIWVDIFKRLSPSQAINHVMAYISTFFSAFRRLYRSEQQYATPQRSIVYPGTVEDSIHGRDHVVKDRLRSDSESTREDDADDGDVMKCIYSRTVAKLLYTGITGCLGKQVVVQYIPDWQNIEAVLGIPPSDDSSMYIEERTSERRTSVRDNVVKFFRDIKPPLPGVRRDPAASNIMIPMSSDVPQSINITETVSKDTGSRTDPDAPYVILSAPMPSPQPLYTPVPPAMLPPTPMQQDPRRASTALEDDVLSFLTQGMENFGWGGDIDAATLLKTAWDPDRFQVAEGWNPRLYHVLTYRKHSSPVTSIASTVQERLFLSASRDPTIRCYVPDESPNAVMTFTEHRSAIVGMHPHNTWMSPHVTSADDRSILIWDLSSGSTIRRMTHASAGTAPANSYGYSSGLSCIDVIDDRGGLVVAGTHEGLVHIYDRRVPDGCVRDFLLPNSATGKFQNVSAIITGGASDGSAVGVAGYLTGHALIVAYGSGSIACLDDRSGEVLDRWEAHDNPITQMKLEGQRLITLSPIDRCVRLWDVSAVTDAGDDIVCAARPPFCSGTRGGMRPTASFRASTGEVLSAIAVHERSLIAASSHRLFTHQLQESYADETVLLSAQVTNHRVRASVTSLCVLPHRLQLLMGMDDGCVRACI